MSDKLIKIEDTGPVLNQQISELSPDDRILLLRENEVVAEVRLRTQVKQRICGNAEGKFEVTDSFFEPLPDELLDSFEGH